MSENNEETMPETNEIEERIDLADVELLASKEVRAIDLAKSYTIEELDAKFLELERVAVNANQSARRAKLASTKLWRALRQARTLGSDGLNTYAS